MIHWKFWNMLAADARLHLLVAWLSQSSMFHNFQCFIHLRKVRLRVDN